jgi:hypothetical protein
MACYNSSFVQTYNSNEIIGGFEIGLPALHSQSA